MSMPSCLAAIVLLLDVSGSVDNTHYTAQRDGTAAAFEHPHVIGTIATSEGVAVALVEFAYRATTRLGWVTIRDEASSLRFAEALRALERSDNGFITAIGDALEHGRELLREPPCNPGLRVIDVSTDGFAEGGRVRPSQARNAAQAAGIEINALLFDAIADPGADPHDAAELAWAEDWLRSHVATGFVRPAYRAGGYATAFRQKLLTEIAGRRP